MLFEKLGELSGVPVGIVQSLVCLKDAGEGSMAGMNQLGDPERIGRFLRVDGCLLLFSAASILAQHTSSRAAEVPEVKRPELSWPAPTRRTSHGRGGGGWGALWIRQT